jgi:methylase of polypeptide subunit release factors
MKETSLQKEPSLALCGGHDGLEQYRRLFRQLNKLKLDPQYLLCEINPSQKTVFTKLIETDLPKYNLVIKNDLSDRPRLAIITKIDN